MAPIVVLDSGPVGVACNRPDLPDVGRVRAWLFGLKLTGARIYLPEVADFEVRRKLLHIRAKHSLRRLDELANEVIYTEITTQVMRKAAQLWADARHRGRPTGDPDALGADVILAAQALLLAGPGDSVTIATENVGHLGQFADARPWANIL